MSLIIKPEEYAERVANIPEELPILPLRNTVAYPFMVMPLVIGIPRSIKLIEDALEGDHLIGLVSMKDSSIEKPEPGQVYEVGIVATVTRVSKSENDTIQIVVQGLERFKIEHWLDTEPYMKARIVLSPDKSEPGLELDALQRSLRDLAKEVVSLTPNMPDEVGAFLDQVHDPRYLTYLVAANANLEMEEGQKILAMDDIKEYSELLASIKMTLDSRGIMNKAVLGGI